MSMAARRQQQLSATQPKMCEGNFHSHVLNWSYIESIPHCKQCASGRSTVPARHFQAAEHVGASLAYRYRQGWPCFFVADAQKSGVAQEAVNKAVKSASGMTAQEARMILEVDPSASWVDVTKVGPVCSHSSSSRHGVVSLPTVLPFSPVVKHLGVGR